MVTILHPSNRFFCCLDSFFSAVNDKYIFFDKAALFSKKAKEPWHTTALKIASYILFFPIALSLFVLYSALGCYYTSGSFKNKTLPIQLPLLEKQDSVPEPIKKMERRSPIASPNAGATCWINVVLETLSASQFSEEIIRAPLSLKKGIESIVIEPGKRPYIETRDETLEELQKRKNIQKSLVDVFEEADKKTATEESMQKSLKILHGTICKNLPREYRREFPEDVGDPDYLTDLLQLIYDNIIFDTKECDFIYSDSNKATYLPQNLQELKEKTGKFPPVIFVHLKRPSGLPSELDMDKTFNLLNAPNEKERALYRIIGIIRNPAHHWLSYIRDGSLWYEYNNGIKTKMSSFSEDVFKQSFKVILERID